MSRLGQSMQSAKEPVPGHIDRKADQYSQAMQFQANMCSAQRTMGTSPERTSRRDSLILCFVLQFLQKMCSIPFSQKICSTPAILFFAIDSIVDSEPTGKSRL